MRLLRRERLRLLLRLPRQVRTRLLPDRLVTAEQAADLVGRQVVLRLDGETDTMEILEATPVEGGGVDVVVESLLTRLDESLGRGALAPGSVRHRP